MEAKQFAELLKSPLLVEQLPVDALRDLVNRYQFSPSLQMLLLKHHQLNEHPAYDEQLAKAAIYAPDRRALYRLVQLKPVVGETRSPYERPEVVTEQPAPEEEPLTASVVEKIVVDEPLVATPETNTWHLPIEPGVLPYENVSDDEIVEEVAPEKQDQTASTESYQPAQHTAEIIEVASYDPENHKLELVEIAPVPFFDLSEFIVPNEPIETAEQTIEESLVEEKAAYIPDQEVVVIPETAEEFFVEEVVVEPTVGTEPEQPVIEDQEILVAQEEVVEVVVVEEGTPTPIVEEVEFVPEIEEKSEPVITAQEDAVIKPQPAIDSKDSFNGWLQRLKRHEIPLIEDQLVISNSKPTTDLGEDKAELDALLGAVSYEAALIKDSIDMPIKPFIDPTARHTKEELMDADSDANKRMDEQARKSLSMGEELVTETLAKIYEIQKKTAKAIEAYEILKQRHPHKAYEYDKKLQKLREG